MLIFLAIGFASETAEVFALQNANATLVSIGTTTEIFFAYTLALVLQGKVPQLFAILGATLIVVVTLCLGFAEMNKGKKEREIDHVDV